MSILKEELSKIFSRSKSTTQNSEKQNMTHRNHTAYLSWTTMYWWGTSPSTPLCRPSHQSSEARWYRSREAPFLKDSSRLVRPQ